jgi:hypothetical protein
MDGPPPEALALPADPRHQAPKHRYISVDAAGNPGRELALKVEVVSMKRCTVDARWACESDADCRDICDNNTDITCDTDAQCPAGGTCISNAPCVEHPHVGESWFVQAPVQSGPLADDWTAMVGPDEYSQVWDLDTLHIGDCEIAPVVDYAVYACVPDSGTCSEPLPVSTQLLPFNAPGVRGNYGDVVGPVDGITLNFTEPDGFANTVDIAAYLFTVQNYGTVNLPQAHPTWIDLHGMGAGNPPQYIINVSDLVQIKFGFLGLPWANASGNLQPGDCPD